MKTLFRLLLGCLVVSSCTCGAQDLRSHMEQMKTAYTASGSIVALDGQTLVIEPNMPGPICAMPREEDGTIAWYRYAFPLSSITVPLADVDESLMSEDRVFTKPEAPKAYKPGDKGDAIMVVVVGMPGKKFRALIYDRDKLEHLGPGSAQQFRLRPDAGSGRSLRTHVQRHRRRPRLRHGSSEMQ